MALKYSSIYFTFIISILQFLMRVDSENETGEKLNDVIIEFINATYIDEDTFDVSVNYKEDENSCSIRLDIINELPQKIILKINVWGRAFGQYKIPTGISLGVDMCDPKLKGLLLEKMFKSIGADISTQCPPKPGNYGVDDFPMKPMDIIPSYALPGLDILTEVELRSPPDISILKVKTYGHVS